MAGQAEGPDGALMCVHAGTERVYEQVPLLLELHGIGMGQATSPHAQRGHLVVRGRRWEQGACTLEGGEEANGPLTAAAPSHPRGAWTDVALNYIPYKRGYGGAMEYSLAKFSTSTVEYARTASTVSLDTW